MTTTDAATLIADARRSERERCIRIVRGATDYCFGHPPDLESIWEGIRFAADLLERAGDVSDSQTLALEIASEWESRQSEIARLKARVAELTAAQSNGGA